MAATKGNQFWKLADFSNRTKKVSVKELEEKTKEYFEFIDNNPHVKIKRDGEKVIEEEFIKPYTIGGLCNWLNIDRKTFDNLGKDKEYVHIITRIREIISANKLEGASAGYFNSNIVALDLGLKNKENNITINQITPLTTQEIKELTNNLGNEYGTIPEITKTIEVNQDKND